MASPETHNSLRSGAVGAIICLAAMWLASSLAFAPMIGA